MAGLRAMPALSGPPERRETAISPSNPSKYIRRYDLLIWALAVSFGLLAVAVALTSARSDKLLLSAEVLVAGVAAARGLFRGGPRTAASVLALLCLVSLLQAPSIDGFAPSIALPMLAGLVLVASLNGRQLLAGLIVAWITGAAGIAIAYFSGELSKLPGAAEAATSVWYLVNLMSMALLATWWAAERWTGAVRAATSAQSKAELEEVRYRRLFEESPDGILVSDAHLNLVDANPAVCHMLGYSKEELLAMPYEQLLDAPDKSQYMSMRPSFIGLHGTWVTERRMRAKDGSLRIVELTARPLPDGTRQLCYRDLTARREAEEELRRMAAAIEQADDLIRIDDPTGVIQYVNPGFERVTGYTAEEAIGKTCASILRSGLQPPALYAELDAAIANGRAWSGRVASRKKDGTIFTQDLRVSPLRDEKGNVVGLVEVGRDVSHEVILEAQLRQAAKMEAIGNLAGGVAHDFNNILTAIRGYAELVRRGLPEDLERDREDLDQIIHSADRASRLTNQLLTFARRTVLEPRVLDPAEVVQEIAPMLRRLLGEHIQLDTSRAMRGQTRIRVDPAQLEQVLLNLAVNARDAMPDGGRLTVGVEQRTLDEAELAGHPEGHAGEFAVLSIRDTGQGMDEDVQRHIFEPFFTTKEPDKGTGMGLATVLGIVKMSDGWIELESAIGKGSAFRLYFPCLPADVPITPSPDRSEETPRGDETILFVEDATPVRAFGRRCLMELGYAVLEAPGPPEALTLAGSYPGKIDLLLSDVVLPGIQGPELAKQIVELRPGIKVLYSSGFTQDATIPSGDGIAYLPKPFTRDGLARAVRKLLDNR